MYAYILFAIQATADNMCMANRKHVYLDKLNSTLGCIKRDTIRIHHQQELE